MFQVFMLLIACSCFAWVYTDLAPHVEYKSGKTDLVKLNSVTPRARNSFYMILIILVCFGGLRTVMNDTWLYMNSFRTKIPDTFDDMANFNWLIGANPLFTLYQIFLKVCISNSPHVFVFITTAFVMVSLVSFIRKYSVDFRLSIFVFIGFTLYGFTLAAMKQSIATSIAVWSFPCIVERKFFKALFLVLLAALFHPYVIVFLLAFFFNKNIWDKSTIFLIILALMIGWTFNIVISIVVNFTSLIGDQYEEFEGGISIFRVLAYWAVPCLSFIYRENLRKVDNKYIVLTINMCVVAGSFSIIARYGGATTVGRLVSYVDVFTCLSLPIILTYGVENKFHRTVIAFMSVPFYCVYYYTYYSKYLPANGSWFTDFYNHISIFNL